MSSSAEPNHPLNKAFAYAESGWHLLPLHSIVEDGCCSCNLEDCASPGKHPRTRHGLKDASINLEVIERHFAQWPDANIGIRTGAESGIVVLDVDPDHGGNESLAELERVHGPLPETVQQITGGGGRHFLFQHPGTPVKNRAGIRPGLDIRGDGGYFVAAGSNHVSGGSYEWVPGFSPDEFELAPMPSWLLKEITSRGPHTSTNPDGSVNERIPEGQRHDHLFRLACHMRGAGAGESAILEALRTTNAEWCEEPLPTAEIEALARDVCDRYEAGSATRDAEAADVQIVEPALDRLRSNLNTDGVGEVVGLIGQLQPLERDHYIQRLYEVAQPLGILKSTLQKEVESQRPRPSEKADTDGEQEELPPPSPEVIEAAEELLRQPNILRPMGMATTTLGQVGEVVNRLVVFLAGVAGHTARTYEDSIHLVIKGNSSSGKNGLLRIVLQLFPPDRVSFLTGLSQQALLYRGGAVEGVLVFQEAEGQQDSEYTTRQAMSEGWLERWTVDENRKPQVLRVEVRGSVFTTTTAIALHAENQTRVLDLQTDNSPDTTRGVLLDIGARAAGEGASDYDREKIIEVWQVALARLEPVEVVIPYAPILAERFPDNPVRVRRNLKKFFGLNRACAVLHQRTRNRDEQGRVVASLDDYEMVFPLIQHVLEPSMSEVSERGLKIADIQAALAEEKGAGMD